MYLPTTTTLTYTYSTSYPVTVISDHTSYIYSTYTSETTYTTSVGSCRLKFYTLANVLRSLFLQLLRQLRFRLLSQRAMFTSPFQLSQPRHTLTPQATQSLSHLTTPSSLLLTFTQHLLARRRTQPQYVCLAKKH